MATYKSAKIGIPYPADVVFNKLSNLEGLGDLIANVPEDKIPEQQREMLKQVSVSADSICFPAGPAGTLTLQLDQVKSPTLILLKGVGAPVPMSLSMNIIPVNDGACEFFVQIDIQIPMMLKPMVNGPLQSMVDQFANMIRQIPFA